MCGDWSFLPVCHRGLSKVDVWLQIKWCDQSEFLLKPMLETWIVALCGQWCFLPVPGVSHLFLPISSNSAFVTLWNQARKCVLYVRSSRTLNPDLPFWKPEVSKVEYVCTLDIPLLYSSFMVSERGVSPLQFNACCIQHLFGIHGTLGCSLSAVWPMQGWFVLKFWMGLGAAGLSGNVEAL